MVTQLRSDPVTPFARLSGIRGVESEPRTFNPLKQVFHHLNHGQARASFVCGHNTTVPLFWALANSQRRSPEFLCGPRSTCRDKGASRWLRRLSSDAADVIPTLALVAQWIEQRPSNP